MKVPLHSTGDASRLAALLLGQICPIFSLVAPCHPGASPVSVRRGTFHHGPLVLLALKRRWADGTTHLVFDPTELLERLAAITPRPRINLILYYGVLGARSAWRAQVVPTQQGGAGTEALNDPRTPSSYRWARLMQRSFGFDVLACARCGGRMRLVALIDQPPAIRRILGHLRLPTAVPEPRPARDPPLLDPNLPSHLSESGAPFEFGA